MKPSYQDAEVGAVEAIKKAIPDSFKSNMLKESRGTFAELFESGVFPNHYAATAIDGVGTKIIIAEAMKKFDTIGIDCVAMNANDLATLGAVSPFLFMDYLACESKIQEKRITGQIVSGMVKGLEECDASQILRNSIKLNFGKGETASVDELISSADGHGFDIAGCMIGFIEKQKFRRQKVTAGDKIIALKSSGPHSNGYTDLRRHLLKGDFETREKFKKLYKGKFSLDDKFEGTTIGKALLEPTKIYVKEMAKIAKDFDVVGINNTGYGLKNLNRINNNFEFRISNPLKPQPIFDLMQKESSFSDEEMYSTFNMGMGFFVLCHKENAEDILQISKDAEIVGEVKKSSKTFAVLEKNGKKISFEGY
ncbi:MAG TPA: phosphoribosylformylglycinamidine cyclo-ligase [Candidatus Nanoarchaeia archaeon]|nr:phosphoribosylformylglycinamidine cyclo-ligase [Candidatus Nanoarchaeia archaeon]